MARPTEYTKEKADKICAQLAEGISLRTVCKAKDMPSVQTIFNWLRTKEGFLEQYARAKEESADAMAEEILDISDDGVNDWMWIQYGKDEENGAWKVNNEAVQRSKLRVDTRKWIMSKMKPKKYGDKLDITSGNKPIPLLNAIRHNDSDKENSQSEKEN